MGHDKPIPLPIITTLLTLYSLHILSNASSNTA